MSYTKGKWKYIEELKAMYSMISGDGVVVAGIPNAIQELDGYAMDLETNRANARRICQCVNNFDDLLEACKKAVGWLLDCEGQVITHNHGVPYDHIRIAEEELKQAIAKAEEGV